MTMKTSSQRTTNIPYATLIMIILFFFLFIISSTTASPAAAAISVDIQFIRYTCNHLPNANATKCYQWFSCLAGELEQNIINLVRAALKVSLNQAQFATNLISSYYNHSHKNAKIGERAKGALGDCMENLQDSMDWMKSSIDQVNELYPPGDPSEFRFNISNIQTWLSTAETDQSTCTDGFDEIVNALKTTTTKNAVAILVLSSAVKACVTPVADVTDLTLALVNSIPC